MVVAVDQVSVPPGFHELLGPYPVLQFFAGLVVLSVMGFGALAWLKGEKIGRDKKWSQNSDDPSVQLFFGGPLKAIFETLAVISANVVAMQQTVATMSGKQELNKLEFKDVLSQQLSQHRHTVLNSLADVQAEVAGDVENQHRDTVKALDGVEREIRELREILVRMEAGLTRRRS